MLKKFRFVYMILAATLLLSACFPTTTADGTTIDATQAAQMVETAVAQALNAQATQIAESIPDATATPLPPTNTAIPAPATATLVPTITPIVLAASPTTVSSGSNSGGSNQTPKYQCYFNGGKEPSDNSLFAAGDAFDIKFTIVNTGTATWVAGIDVKYGYNTDLTNGGVSRTEIPVALAPGQSYVIGPFDAWAPAKSGHYVMGFIVEGIDNCIPYIAIDVK